jgi:tetratricopeptide (TPR) repeat protein
MLAHDRKILFSLIFIFCMGTACAQTRRAAKEDKPKFEVTVSGAATGKEAERLLKEAGRQSENRGKFGEESRQCNSLMKERKLKEAETACRAALRLADQLEAESKLERMGAYEAVGHVMLGQKRYTEALEYYSRALDVGRPELSEDAGELGRLYGNLATAQHLLGELSKARELYRKSEQIYQRAYATFGEGGTDEWTAAVRAGYLKSLKLILNHHLIAAEDAGATSEVEEIEKQIKSLP